MRSNPRRPTPSPPLDLDRWRGRTRPDPGDDPWAMQDMIAVLIVIGCVLLLSWAAYWGLS